jgi:1-aminocyclopropane-1-carboxylate deaminase
VLDGFIDDFRDRHDIVLDWVYEGKMMYGLSSFLRRGEFEPGTTLVALLA